MISLFNTTSGLAVIAGALAILVIILFLFKVSVKVILKLVINALIGAVVLYLINFIPKVDIPITWLSALATGIFGIPAVIVIVIVYFINK